MLTETSVLDAIDPTATRHRVFSLAARLSKKMFLVVPLTGAFLLGMIINALSDTNIHTLRDALQRVYDFETRPAIAWVNATITAIAILLLAGRLVLKKMARRDRFAIRLAALYESRVEQDIRPFAHGRIAWGSSIVLQPCPNLEEGWKLSDINISKSPTGFRFEDESERRLFDQWVADQESQGVNLQGSKFRLTKDPRAFLDAPSLDLIVEDTSYAQARFYAHSQAQLAYVRRNSVRRAVNGTIDFPHSVALHIIVATADDYVLITQRSAKVDYFPNLWSCSIEEQLDSSDFPSGGGPGSVMSNWAVRSLREELRIDESAINPTNIRVSCVFLESDLLACSLVALATLNIDKDSLDAIIAKRPRGEREYVDWNFLHWRELPAELLRPNYHYHPTSGLRMFLGGIMRFGSRDFGLRLYRASKRTPRRNASRRS